MFLLIERVIEVDKEIVKNSYKRNRASPKYVGVKISR